MGTIGRFRRQADSFLRAKQRSERLGVRHECRGQLSAGCGRQCEVPDELCDCVIVEYNSCVKSKM